VSESEAPIGGELFGYRIEGLLGRGGMGVVYLCEDLRLRRRVALKLLTASLAQDAEFRERFLAEAELAASLDHPNVVPIYEAGDVDGQLFIAMRYVEGRDLRALIRDGPLSAERALGLCAQVAEALDFAHQHGLVHGDVKPANVLVDARDHVYLADFGVTRRLEAPQAVEPGLLGTIDYAAPELIRGEQLDARADEYSLACVLHECLTGQTPFARPSSPAVLFAHLEEPPPAPPGLEAVMETALAKDRADRFETCAEVTAAAAEALGIGQHADWGRRATEWDRHGRRRAFLLTGANLEAAERWRREAASREPAPSVLHNEFIDASRQAVTRRLRRIQAFVSVALVVAIGLAIVALVQRQIAVTNQQTAQSLQLAANAEATLTTDPELSTLLALQALRVRDTPQAEQALRDALPQLRILARLRPDGTVNGAALSPNGREIVTVGQAGPASVWSTSSHRRLAVLAPPDYTYVTSAAFSPDGKQIITATNAGDVLFWSTKSHQRVGRPIDVYAPGDLGDQISAAFTPDGERIVIAGDDGVAIWSASHHHELGRLTVPVASASTTAALSPDGTEMLTVSSSGTVSRTSLWSVSSHRRLAVLTEPTNGGNGQGSFLERAAFSPDGSAIVTASNDGTARIWSTSTHRQLAVLTEPGDTWLQSAAFSPDGKEIVTASRDGTARIWSTSSHQQLAVFTESDASPLLSAGFSPDGRELVTVSQDGGVRIWDATDPQQLAMFGDSSGGPLNDAEFSPDSTQIVTASLNGTARIWSASSHRELAVLTEPDRSPIETAAFSPDGRRIVTAANDARIWSASDHRQLAVLAQSCGCLYNGAAFSPNGEKIVTAPAYSNAGIWSASDGYRLPALLGPSPGGTGSSSAAFSPDGKLIVTAGNPSIPGNAMIWNATSDNLLAVLAEPGGSPLATAAFSPDGAEIVTASADGTARVWSTSSHRQLAVLTEPGGSPLYSAAFSPDGRQIVTASGDGTARIWSAASHQELTVLGEPGDSAVERAAFSTDGNEVVTASLNGTARIWSTELARPIQTLERIAEKRVTRELTPGEMKRYDVP
jgi:WD40 repeat protein/predicted Ser/Thr protein kinase